MCLLHYLVGGACSCKKILVHVQKLKELFDGIVQEVRSSRSSTQELNQEPQSVPVSDSAVSV